MDMTQKAATATARDKRRVQEGGKRMTHKRQCAAAKVMAQATGDSRRQSDDGETKRSDSESKPSKTWRKFLFIFLSISLCFFVEAKPWAAPLHTNTHTLTHAQWDSGSSALI